MFSSAEITKPDRLSDAGTMARAFSWMHGQAFLPNDRPTKNGQPQSRSGV
jgi:hypothetical protein